MRALVVDDSGTMRTIIKRGLSLLSVTQVADAEDGVQALSLFKSAEFDLILSDWNMPNMDGLEFLENVRSINETIPFIMITTEAERSRVVSAIQAGVSDYIVKPFTVDVLKAKLDRWIPAAT
ncbi:response regulator [Thalassoroseus pseudoceratinae]|uniref:response regulator n=1 Tax=Thalassoroseus pseudoceratinae TaxID=2713176 RepID=UPI0014241BC6|nr:response regulator [Thalassoroseus pseudoceratinae]